MKIYLDPGAKAPTRANPEDAGADIYALHGGTILPGEGEVFQTGVHAEIPAGCCGLLVSKSGLNVAHGITSTGLIDEGYTGEILVKLYNHGEIPYTVNAGDKISQLVIIPILRPELEMVNEICWGAARGDKGFGSGGK